MCRGMRHWEHPWLVRGVGAQLLEEPWGKGHCRGVWRLNHSSQKSQSNLFGSLSSSLGMGSPGEERKSCPGNSHHPCTQKGFTGMAQTAALLCPCTSQPKVGSACFAPDLTSSEQSPWRRERRGDTGFVPSTSCR